MPNKSLELKLILSRPTEEFRFGEIDRAIRVLLDYRNLVGKKIGVPLLPLLPRIDMSESKFLSRFIPSDKKARDNDRKAEIITIDKKVEELRLRSHELNESLTSDTIHGLVSQGFLPQPFAFPTEIRNDKVLFPIEKQSQHNRLLEPNINESDNIKSHPQVAAYFVHVDDEQGVQAASVQIPLRSTRGVSSVAATRSTNESNFDISTDAMSRHSHNPHPDIGNPLNKSRGWVKDHRAADELSQDCDRVKPSPTK